MEPLTFVLTADHLKLLRHLHVGNEKRPYGNSYIEGDVISILDWEVLDHDEGPTEQQELDALQVHRETPTALQIVLCTQSFVPGLYRKNRQYSQTSWELVKEAK